MMPVLLYGCETWVLHNDQKLNIQTTQVTALMRKEEKCWKNHVPNVENLQRQGQSGMLETVRRR